MRPTITPYQDGWFGNEEVLSVIPKPKFPFRTSPTPDIYSRVYDWMFQIEPRLFIPKIANRTSWANLLTYSEAFDNAAWTKTNLTVTADSATAPDGQTTLDKLLETVTNAEHSVTQAATVTAAATEVTVFAVGGLTRTWIRVAFIDSAATTFSAFFNIASGYIGTKSAGVTSKIVALGNNQFRCVVRFTPAAGAGTFKVNVSTDGSTISYAGTITAGVYLWGAQVTTGTETPYISTTTATRTISAPDRDRVDPFAFLVEEEDPEMTTSLAGIARRSFSRIPLPQTKPSSLFVTLPDIPGTFPQILGTFLVFKPDETKASYDGYLTKTVSVDSGTTAATYPTGGTYTLTFAGSTTGALNYNDAAATVQTALNALTSVTNRGSVAVTGAYNTAAGLAVAFSTYAAATAGTGSLTSSSSPINASTSVSSANSGYVQTISIENLTFASDWSGGTFTLTMFTQTTAAIAYNASAATIQAALNALTNVQARGNCTVTLPTGQTTAYVLVPRSFTGVDGAVFNYTIATIRFTVSFANAAITATSSVTPAGSLILPSITDGAVGQSQVIYFTGVPGGRTLTTSAAHTIVAADDIYIKADGSYYFIDSGLFTVPSTTSIRLNVAGTAYATAASITEVGKRTIEGYTAGVKQARVNYVQTFYLPGVTPDVATSADIPLPAYEGDPTTLLLAIFNGDTSINYQVGVLEQWRGPIEVRMITTLDATQL